MEIVKKEFTYRGKTIEELKQMNLREFARLLKSNERRTVLRQTDELERFISKASKKIEKRGPVRTHLRHLVVVPRMIDMNINIYNGKEFVPIKIMAEMLGHRFGEFSATRLKVKHGAAGIGATRSSASLSVK